MHLHRQHLKFLLHQHYQQLQPHQQQLQPLPSVKSEQKPRERSSVCTIRNKSGPRNRLVLFHNPHGGHHPLAYRYHRKFASQLLRLPQFARHPAPRGDLRSPVFIPTTIVPRSLLVGRQVPHTQSPGPFQQHTHRRQANQHLHAVQVLVLQVPEDVVCVIFCALLRRVLAATTKSDGRPVTVIHSCQLPTHRFFYEVQVGRRRRDKALPHVFLH